MAKSPAAPPRKIIEGPFEDLSQAPPRVVALREKVLAACATRDVEALRVPIQWAETPPIFSRGSDRPKSFEKIVDFLRQRSFDRRGVEMTQVIRAAFESPFARQKIGPFVTYVWPAAALLPPDKWEGEAAASLFALVRFADLGLVDADGRPLIHAAGVGEDGTWHSFLTKDAAPPPAASPKSDAPKAGVLNPAAPPPFRR
jgi:hypothetical protein